MQPEVTSKQLSHEDQPDQGASASRVSRHATKWFLVVPVLLAIGGAVTFYLRARDSKTLAATTQTMVAEPVTVTHPQPGQPVEDLSLPSTLQAYSDSPIYARTSGYVAHWYADIGTHVRQGQLLAVIDSPEVDQELSQARATLSQTEANLKLAGVTAQRYQDLTGTNAVAQQEIDTNTQNLSAQQAALQASIANVKRLEALQGFERVTAPFDGVITQRLTDIGNLVNAGNSGIGAQLFRISKINTMRVFVPVPEVYSNEVKAGLSATLDLIQIPDQHFAGSVTRSSDLIDPGSHTLLTEVDVPNPKGTLLPGAYANVHLHLGTKARGLLVPTGAVLFQAAGPQVAVVNASSRVELHKVSIGRDFGNTIEINGGLSASDNIVANPPDYLIDGMPVTVQPAGGQPASANAKS
jgi:RND family efflux transporter MFP subunit